MRDEKRRREAVALILSGQSNAADQARRLNISKRQVERLVAAAKAAGGEASVAASVVSDPVGPPEKTSPEAPNEALLAAKEGAGLAAGKPGAAPPTSTDVALGQEDCIKFCRDQVANLKQSVGGVLVTFRYSPPLKMSDQDVLEAMKLSPIEEGAIRANWQLLYPILLKWMKGPYQIFGALVMGQFLMVMALRTAAESRGWKAPESAKKEEEDRQAKFRRDLAPRPAPLPPPPPKSEEPVDPEKEKGRNTIVNSPTPAELGLP